MIKIIMAAAAILVLAALLILNYLATIGNNPTGLEDRYDNYLVYTREMADKLDEIAGKYNLKLHTNLAVVPAEEWENLVGKITRDERNILDSGYIYENGSFHYDGDFALAPDNVIGFQFQREVKGTLSETTLCIGDADDYITTSELLQYTLVIIAIVALFKGRK